MVIQNRSHSAGSVRGGRRGRSAVSVALGSAVALMVLRPFAPAAASTISLRDGTTISGEIVSLSEGRYVVRSATLGTVSVKQDDVASVTEQPAAPAAAPIDAMQERITADPAAVQAIAALQDDPDVQAILSDPALLEALRKGDLETLMANPKIARFAANPRVQEITNKIAAEPAPVPDTASPSAK